MSYSENLDVFCILKYKMIEASINVNPFASHTGRLLLAQSINKPHKGT